MLAVNLNPLIDSKEIDKFSIIKLRSYTTNAVQGRRYVKLSLSVELVADYQAAHFAGI